MFSSKKKAKGMTSSFDSYFGEDIVIDGNIEAKGNVRLDGLINGDMKLSSSLIIGEKGRVDGNVKGTRIEVFGRVDGNIYASEGLSIEKSGTVIGDIEVASMLINEGGNFDGNCKMIGGKQDINKMKSVGTNKTVDLPE